MALSRSLLFADPIAFSFSTPFPSKSPFLPPFAADRSLALRSRRDPSIRSRSRGISAVRSEFPAVAAGENLPEEYATRFPAVDPGRRRRAGVLLHPTSLRGPYGIGDLGDEALRFLDWLHSAGCAVWQVFSFFFFNLVFFLLFCIILFRLAKIIF